MYWAGHCTGLNFGSLSLYCHLCQDTIYDTDFDAAIMVRTTLHAWQQSDPCLLWFFTSCSEPATALKCKFYNTWPSQPSSKLRGAKNRGRDTPGTCSVVNTPTWWYQLAGGCHPGKAGDQWEGGGGQAPHAGTGLGAGIR